MSNMMLVHKRVDATLVIVQGRYRENWLRVITEHPDGKSCVQWFKKTKAAWYWPALSTQKRMEDAWQKHPGRVG